MESLVVPLNLMECSVVLPRLADRTHQLFKARAGTSRAFKKCRGGLGFIGRWVSYQGNGGEGNGRKGYVEADNR